MSCAKRFGASSIRTEPEAASGGIGVRSEDETRWGRGAHSCRSGGSGDRIATAGLRMASAMRIRRGVSSLVPPSRARLNAPPAGVALPVVSAIDGCVTGPWMIGQRVSPATWRRGRLAHPHARSVDATPFSRTAAQPSFCCCRSALRQAISASEKRVVSGLDLCPVPCAYFKHLRGDS